MGAGVIQGADNTKRWLAAGVRPKKWRHPAFTRKRLPKFAVISVAIGAIFFLWISRVDFEQDATSRMLEQSDSELQSFYVENNRKYLVISEDIMC